MTVKINHTKVSGKAAGTDATRVYGTHWDADHTIVGLEDEIAQAVLIGTVKFYGASGSAQTTTGTIGAGSSALALGGGAIDFANGQGILVLQAGAAASVGAPTITSVAPVNSTGSTTYAYKLVSRDNTGGLSAATAATTISNGDAALGTYQSGILGVTMNQIIWTMGSGSPQSTGVYRSKNGAAYEFLGCFKGTAINDAGLPATSLMGFPAIPPATSVPGWLATTIVSGGGSTALTLANPAGNTAAGATIFHDDTAAILAAAAATPALYFSAGTYNVRGLQLPSSVHGIVGDGPGSCSIVSYAETADGLVAGVSASMAGGKLYMSGIRIVAGLPMAFDGFVLSNSASSGIYGCEFAGLTALHIVSSAYPVAQGNQISGWWNVGIYSDTNTNERILGNTISPISGQVGTVALTNTPVGSAYAYESGIIAINGAGAAGTRLIGGNTVVMNGGIWGIGAGGGATLVESNAIFSSGREAMVGGAAAIGSIGSNATFRGNDCTWAPAGNGNLSCYDFGFSTADDGINPTTNLVVTNNKFTNPGYSGIGIFGSGTVGAPYTGIIISDNQIYGSNQLFFASYGIYLQGRNVLGAIVANNTVKSVTANMTYNVGEAEGGVGVPDFTVVSLPLGDPGSLGYVNLLGANSKSYLLPSHTGQLATLAGVENLSNKTLPTPIVITPDVRFGTGASGGIAADSINTGFTNSLVASNSGTVSNASTRSTVDAQLSSGSSVYARLMISGGASPLAQLVSGPGATAGLNISAGAGPLVLLNPTISGSFTATGLVKNADLVNASLTINGTSVALGASATITAAPSGAAGGELGGNYPNPTLSNAFVIAKLLTGYASGAGTVSASDSILSALQKINGNDALKAPIASPTFTGTPAAPTPAVDTNTTQLATTAMVLAQAASATPLIDGTATVGTSTRFARGDHIHPTDTTRAPLASPTFTGTVTIPSGGSFGTPNSINLSNASNLPIGGGGTNATTAQGAAANLKVPYILAQSYVQVPHTGDLLEATLATITIPANAMGPNGCVRLTFYISSTSSANTKTVKVYFNGTGGTAYIGIGVTTQLSNRFQVQICNRNATNSQVGNHFQAQGGFGGSPGSVVTSAVDTTASVNIVITGQLTNTGETVALEGYTAELLVP